MELSVKDGKRVSGKVRYNGAKVWQSITKKDYMWWHTTLGQSLMHSVHVNA